MKTETIARIMAVVLLAITLMHLLVIGGVIPYEYVGGGRYPDLTAARVGEVFAALVSALFAGVAAARGRWLHRPGDRSLRVLLWIMAILFAVNTLGNLAAVTTVEMVVAAPVTALLAVGSFVLARRTPAPAKVDA